MTERILTDANGRKYITREPLLHLSQREWQGLTTDELKEIKDRFKLTGLNIAVAFRTVEAKLREKNT
ncbi:hypothetical protein UFOVP195_14 [uncultured Caudovirales phage]|uniref:Uncharacterized protein n=1 Tax=uncultured Caudovirales phage TaxID=2100421 RepID=A0A6J7WGB7_9CAUD|nr:hypothetical protein UFOVP195_14 [uncultured Caudovirales phage]